ncbi:MAG: hypothetical protein O3B84_05135 [Chloroflexi bacterium]|nr:hypothetical protein [Chloroflexota bacterium]
MRTADQFNPFANVRVRWLIVWLIAGTPVAITLAVTAAFFLLRQDVIDELLDPMVVAVASSLSMQGVLLLWVFWLVARRKISIQRLLGRVPRHYAWGTALFVLIAMMVYSVGAYWALFVPVSPSRARRPRRCAVRASLRRRF